MFCLIKNVKSEQADPDQFKLNLDKHIEEHFKNEGNDSKMDEFLTNLKPKEEIARKDKENLTNLRSLSIKTFPEYWDKPYSEKSPG